MSLSSLNLLRAATRCTHRANRLKNASLLLQEGFSKKITRPFTRSRISSAALASHSQAKPSIIIFSPTKEQLEKEEIDVDLIPPQDIKLEITERAAEQLRQIASRESNPDAALRIAVESGGCHGYQYKMELAIHRQADD
jgi:hypothetical protein